MVVSQQGGGAVGVENAPEGEPVVPLENPQVVVAGVGHLHDRRVRKKTPQSGQIQARERIDEVGALFIG